MNSFPSSIMVKSAPKQVSSTLSKPKRRREVTILPVISDPAGMPCVSPKEARTAGAVWAITIFEGSEMAAFTSFMCSFSFIAPVWQERVHCPQYAQKAEFSV